MKHLVGKLYALQLEALTSGQGRADLVNPPLEVGNV